MRHVFLWIPPQGEMITESMSRLQVERVGCDPQLIAAPVWQDWQKKLTKQVTNQSLLMAYRYFLGLQGFSFYFIMISTALFCLRQSL